MKFLIALLIVTIAVASAAAVFGWAIMIASGVLAATFSWPTLSFGSSWVLGLCWAILASAANVKGVKK